MSQYRQPWIGKNRRHRSDNFDYLNAVKIQSQSLVKLNVCRFLLTDVTRQRRDCRRCWSEKLAVTSLSLTKVILYNVQLLNHFPVA